MFILLTSLAWLAVLVGAPGLALLRSLGCAFERRSDNVLAACAASLSLGGAFVYVALFFGIYTRRLACIWALGPCLYLVWHASRRDARLSRLLRPGAQEAPGHQRDRTSGRLARWTRVGVCWAGAALLFWAFLEAVSSPVTSWDAVITWDKWASDWARRVHLHNYLFGYPQLLPMFGSLIYKLAPAGTEVLAPPAWALHALHPLLGLLLAAAVARLAALSKLPAWPVLLLLAGAPIVRGQLVAGTADLLVTALVSVSVALYLAMGPVGVPLTPRHQALLVLLLWAPIAAKTTGILAAAALLALECGRPDGEPSQRRERRVWLLQAVGAALALNLPFYFQQWASARSTPLSRLDRSEVHFTITQLAPALRAATEGHTTSLAQVLTQLGLLAGQSAPTWSACVIVPWLAAFGCALGARRTRLFAALLLAYVLAWRYWLSYDMRNLLPAIPLLAVCVAMGAARLLARIRCGARRRVCLALLVLPLALSAGNLALHLAQAWPALLRALPERQLALHGDLARRVRIFFPSLFPEYALIRALDPAAHGAHLLAASFHYRFFPGSVYPLSSYDWGDLRAGDLLLDTPPRGPAVYADAWWPVRRDWYWLFVYAPHARRLPSPAWLLTGWHPPRLVRVDTGLGVVQFAGEQSLLVHDVLPERPPPGSWVTWRVEADATAQAERVRPFHMVYDASVVWPGSLSLHVEREYVPAGRVAYTGLLRLGAGALSTRPVDGVLVGVACDVPGTRLRVRDFRVALVPPSAPRP
jgi:hypothetical protein